MGPPCRNMPVPGDFDDTPDDETLNYWVGEARQEREEEWKQWGLMSPFVASDPISSFILDEYSVELVNLIRKGGDSLELYHRIKHTYINTDLEDRALELLNEYRIEAQERADEAAAESREDRANYEWEGYDAP